MSAGFVEKYCLKLETYFIIFSRAILHYTTVLSTEILVIMLYSCFFSKSCDFFHEYVLDRFSFPFVSNSVLLPNASNRNTGGGNLFLFFWSCAGGMHLSIVVCLSQYFLKIWKHKGKFKLLTFIWFEIEIKYFFEVAEV